MRNQSAVSENGEVTMAEYASARENLGISDSEFIGSEQAPRIARVYYEQARTYPLRGMQPRRFERN